MECLVHWNYSQVAGVFFFICYYRVAISCFIERCIEQLSSRQIRNGHFVDFNSAGGPPSCGRLSLLIFIVQCCAVQLAIAHLIQIEMQ